MYIYSNVRANNIQTQLGGAVPMRCSKENTEDHKHVWVSRKGNPEVKRCTECGTWLLSRSFFHGVAENYSISRKDRVVGGIVLPFRSSDTV